MDNIGSLKNLKYISSESFKDIKQYNDILLICGLAVEFQKTYEAELVRSLDAGVPPILVCDYPCDFIEFEGNSHQFTCIKRDLYIQREGRWDNSTSCLKNGQNHPKLNLTPGNKPCDKKQSNHLLSKVLSLFRGMFPKVKVGKDDEKKGKIPIFFYSDFLNYLMFNYFFGRELFKRRYNYNKLQEGIAGDTLLKGG